MSKALNINYLRNGFCGLMASAAALSGGADASAAVSDYLAETVDTVAVHQLEEFVLTQKKRGTVKSFGAENKSLINQTELFKAACCNLGESFTTSPSVDVSYSDAATGARQIKLLGLSGTYVQMLTESMPAFRGAASPYGFRYVPGPWMKSISVSKGCSTVKNGYESITGQINIEYLKPQEEAWIYGLSADYTRYLGSHKLILNAEYFYTDFKSQAVVDYDTDPGLLTIAQLDGRSYSHTFQVDATWESPFGVSLTGAYRINDVKTAYGGVLREKPLTSRYKALLTLSYSTPLELWQFDVAFQMNGGGRLPAPYALPDGNMSWGPRFEAFPQLNLQVTRWFRHFSIYAEGENLTNFKQKNPVVWSADPWSSHLDPTTVWGPYTGPWLCGYPL